MHSIMNRASVSGFLLSLLSCLSVAPATAANDCAILATGAASDLALDDPERFEYLTRACGDGPPSPPGPVRTTPRAAPPAPVVQGRGATPRKAAGTSSPDALRRVDDSPKGHDADTGCDYLFYPVKNLKHRIGTEACRNNRNLVCRKNAEGVLGWDEGGSACATAPNAIPTMELNTRNIHRTKDHVDESFKD